MADLTLDDVLPFDRPMSAGPNDTFVGMTETGDKIYETLTGQQYSVRPATTEETDARQPLPVKAEKWVDEGMPLPSWDQITTSIKAMPQAMYDTVDRVTDGTGTFGDVFGTIGASAAPGMVSRVGQAADSSVVSAMGATHKVPRYAEKKPEIRGKNDEDLYDEDGFLSLDDLDVNNVDEDFTPQGWGSVEGYTPSQQITFRDPLVGIYEEMEIPNKGLKGSELIKQLQDNPTVRNSQLSSMGIFDKIDPQKRYTDDEVGKLFLENAYSVKAIPQTQYQSYQRQFDLVDKETDYVEYAINADNVRSDQPKFKANSQHYQDNTLAHVRLSDRAGKDGPYVLIEEFQSDLLQKGYQKPIKGGGKNLSAQVDEFFSDPENLIDEFQFYEPDIFHFSGKIDKEDFLRYQDRANNPDDVVDDILERSGSLLTRGNQLSLKNVFVVLEEKFATQESITAPPIAKTEESVRLALDTAIAHASKKGMTKVVIPPFHKIVEKRFSNPIDIAKAMDPKSGFYATYVSGLNKVLKDMQQEFGDKVKIGKTDLEYDPNKKENDFGDPLTDAPEIYDVYDLNFQTTFREVFAQQTGADVGQGFTPRIARIVQNTTLSLLRGVPPDNPADFEVWNAGMTAMERTTPAFSVGRFEEFIAQGLNTREAFKAATKGEVKPKSPNTVEQGIEIDFGGVVEQNYDLSRPKFAEGGMVLDPVSKNPVPTGAHAKEVRDDVPIMASEGEYVIPANVVRFLGLDKIEKLVSGAKTKLEEMKAKGRIGGEGEEDLPFSPEELQAIDAPEQAPASAGPPQMATGGVVPPAEDQIDPVTGMPTWMSTNPYTVPSSVTPPVPTAAPPMAPMEMGRPDVPDKPKDVSEWSPDQFEQYATTRNSPAGQFMQGMASMVPGGGLMAKAQQRSLERRVPTELAKMLETKTDLQGNPLSPEQLSSLGSAYDKMTTEALTGFGFGGVAKSFAQDVGLISKKTVTPEEQKAPKKDSIVSRVIDAVTQTGKTAEEKAADKATKDKEKADKEKADKEAKDKASSTSKK